jgi:hypothetical protein
MKNLFNNAFSRSSKLSRLVWVTLFFMAIVINGISIYRDYGISWDEPGQTMNGIVTLKYLGEKFVPNLMSSPAYSEKIKNISPLHIYPPKYYGVVFEAPLALMQLMLPFDIKDWHNQIMFRHLITFLFSILGVFAVFRLAERWFSDWRLGLFAAFLLLLSPRLFADSFYNSKDIVFMAIFSVCMYTLVSFIQTPNFKTTLYHALVTAIAIDVRIVGIILPAATLFFLLLRLIRREAPIPSSLRFMVIYLIISGFFVVLFWPVLWENPLQNFLNAYVQMSHYPWGGNILFMGKRMLATQIPWYYIPVWIAISTPFIYLALFLLGAASITRQIIKRGNQFWDGDSEMQNIIFLSLFIGPILIVILLQSALYDGWRQMYFLYPSFILIVVKGWLVLWSKKSWGIGYNILLIAVMTLSITNVAQWMVRVHPLQNVYFNFLAGKDWRHNFEMDYWGLANRQALEYILENDAKPFIKVYQASETPLNSSKMILKNDQKSRLIIVDNKNEELEADYILTNYRGVGDYVSPDNKTKIWYNLVIDDEIILSIYKRTQ